MPTQPIILVETRGNAETSSTGKVLTLIGIASALLGACGQLSSPAVTPSQAPARLPTTTSTSTPDAPSILATSSPERTFYGNGLKVITSADKLGPDDQATVDRYKNDFLADGFVKYEGLNYYSTTVLQAEGVNPQDHKSGSVEMAMTIATNPRYPTTPLLYFQFRGMNPSTSKSETLLIDENGSWNQPDLFEGPGDMFSVVMKGSTTVNGILTTASGILSYQYTPLACLKPNMSPAELVEALKACQLVSTTIVNPVTGEKVITENSSPAKPSQAIFNRGFLAVVDLVNLKIPVTVTLSELGVTNKDVLTAFAGAEKTITQEANGTYSTNGTSISENTTKDGSDVITNQKYTIDIKTFNNHSEIKNFYAPATVNATNPEGKQVTLIWNKDLGWIENETLSQDPNNLTDFPYQYREAFLKMVLLQGQDPWQNKGGGKLAINGQARGDINGNVITDDKGNVQKIAVLRTYDGKISYFVPSNFQLRVTLPNGQKNYVNPGDLDDVNGTKIIMAAYSQSFDMGTLQNILHPKKGSGWKPIVDFILKADQLALNKGNFEPFPKPPGDLNSIVELSANDLANAQFIVTSGHVDSSLLSLQANAETYYNNATPKQPSEAGLSQSSFTVSLPDEIQAEILGAFTENLFIFK